MGRKLSRNIAATLGASLVTIGAAATAQHARVEPAGPSATSNGAQAYAQHCAACHGPTLNGPIGPNVGVPLRGPAFVAKWAARPDALVDFSRTMMPLQNPDSLDPNTYAEIVGFIRAENGMQAGAKPTPATHDQASDISSSLVKMMSPDVAPDKTALATRERLNGLAASVTPVTDEMMRNPADGDWIAWRRTQGTDGFSPLKQINRGNVAQLGLAWSLALGNGTNGIAPLVHDGVMYINSSGTIRALDATNGDVIWEFVRPATATRAPSSQPRGFALYGDSVIVPTLDNHVLSLDAKTGKLRWDHQIGKEEDKLQLSAGPLIAGGKVIQGVSGCSGAELKGGCYIVALDAATGNELWRFYTIARPDAPGGNSWNGMPLEGRFGGSVWVTGSYDPDLNLVYFGTGQTYVVSPLLADGAPKNTTRDALYTNTTLALNPDTGKLVWHYQHVAGDVWDLDWVFERTLATVPGPKGPRKIVVTVGKTGIIDALDARTGKYLWSLDMGMQNLITSIDPKTGRKTHDLSLIPEKGKLKLVCPGTVGARNWNSTAYDPGSGLLYLPMFETCNDMGLFEDSASTSSYTNYGEFKTIPRPKPGTDGQFGRVAAVDIRTGRRTWTNKYRAEPLNALLATAGGLVFAGTRDRWFRALDAASGEELWRARLDNVPNSFPISYMVKGRQYLAVASGAGSSIDITVKWAAAEIPNVGPGRTLTVFALPEKFEK